MMNTKRRRPKPLIPTEEAQEYARKVEKSAQPMSFHFDGIAPGTPFWNFKFAVTGIVGSPCIETRLLGDPNPHIRVKAVRGPASMEQSYPVKQGVNSFPTFGVEAGDVLMASSDVPLGETWITFLFREA